MHDDEIIKKVANENWILVTNDKDFGEEVYRQRRPHGGLVLLRLANERASNKIVVLQRLLESHADRLHDQFVVVTETRARFGP